MTPLQSPIHIDTIKTFSGQVEIRYQLYQPSFIKTDYFKLWFLYKSDLSISTAGKHKGIIKIKTL